MFYLLLTVKKQLKSYVQLAGRLLNITSHSIKSVVKTRVNIPGLGCCAGKGTEVGIAIDVCGTEGNPRELKPGADVGLYCQNLR